MADKNRNMHITTGTSSAKEQIEAMQAQCYCDNTTMDDQMLQCKTCKHNFHKGCLKKILPTSLSGDVLFNLTCSSCSANGEEHISRPKLQWLQVVILALYNLQLTKQGKGNFFRWKDHICGFIDKHWVTFFGPGTRRKGTTWQGTVAGVLSTGSPHYFVPGSSELKEAGWWRLREHKPPPTLLDLEVTSRRYSKRDREDNEVVKLEGLRSRRSRSSYQAAIELKAKRYGGFTESKESKKDSTDRTRGSRESLDKGASIVTTTPPKASKGAEISKTRLSTGPTQSEALIQANSRQVSPIGDTSSENSRDNWFTEKDLVIGNELPDLLLHDEEDGDMDSDFEVDPCGMTPPSSPPFNQPLPDMEDILSSLGEPSTSGFESSKLVKIEKESDSDSDMSSIDVAPPVVPEQVPSNSDHPVNQSPPGSEVSSESEDEANGLQLRVDNRMKRISAAIAVPPPKPPPIKYMPVSLHEERQLLRRLQNVYNCGSLTPDLNRFRQKLKVRQIKREKGQALFDIDAEMYRLTGSSKENTNMSQYMLNPHNVPSPYQQGDYRVLDRFQHPTFSLPRENQKISFINRLIGTDDEQLESIRSPYTARMLKPYIRRDYESQPIKMRLLQEIISYPNRNMPDVKPPKMPPIDYCYIRPQHIPSVNALARQFFWPGIDLSECLQYPDFSCVVLYRKFLIGFAFMVPDVKYNEAYISFLFTHPEWRGAGIGTFMLYHLIQTCMGKDVTLHVSATNPAMLLYQKFGFKPEEFILNFYDKYFHESSKDCTIARNAGTNAGVPSKEMLVLKWVNQCKNIGTIAGGTNEQMLGWYLCRATNGKNTGTNNA
ncbi:unnamed protein product [Owenia fusiformis]|uniref:N-acetyltransferase domain-containing protein n=1 Tax=Owenia fusiformis TaxID=6347 RepID=A0A8S4N440_OWEFU|nr:unnamed protein product [Owenia fusiformis]